MCITLYIVKVEIKLFSQFMDKSAYVLVTQSGPTLCDSMDHSLPDSSVHGISQAVIPFSRGSSWLRD